VPSSKGCSANQFEQGAERPLLLQAEPSVRRYLQTEVARASRARGSLERLLSRLAERSVEFIGHVCRVRYRARGVTLAGGDLGTAFTWPALERQESVGIRPRERPDRASPLGAPFYFRTEGRRLR
jgi:hypothetical protein